MKGGDKIGKEEKSESKKNSTGVFSIHQTVKG